MLPAVAECDWDYVTPAATSSRMGDRVSSSKNLATHTSVCLPTVTTHYRTIVHNPLQQLMAPGHKFNKKKIKELYL